jgi:hypothetical protein
MNEWVAIVFGDTLKAEAFTMAAIFGWSDARMALRYTHATDANMKQAVRSLDTLSARLGNVLATKTKTAGAVPP